MRVRYCVLFILVGLGALGSLSQAALLYSENFDSMTADQALSGQGGWTGPIAGLYQGLTTVKAANAVSPSNSVRTYGPTWMYGDTLGGRYLSPAFTLTNEVWVGATVKYTEVATYHGGDYSEPYGDRRMTPLFLYNNANGNTTGMLRIQPDPSDPSKFDLGLQTRFYDATGANWTSALSINTQYNIAMQSNGSAGTMSLYVYDALNNLVSSITHTGSAAWSSSNVFLSSTQNPGGSWQTPGVGWWDELKVGTTMADVLVPEPTSLALLGLMGLGLLARRRG